MTLTFEILNLKVVSESRVTWAMLYANFGLPRPLCSRLRPDVRDRQTDVRQKRRLIPTPIRGWGITMNGCVRCGVVQQSRVFQAAASVRL